MITLMKFFSQDFVYNKRELFKQEKKVFSIHFTYREKKTF